MASFSRSSKRGFTLIEVLVFTAVFSGMAIILFTIIVVVSRVQARENAVAEVNQQSNFILRTVQTSVQGASLIEMDTDSPTSTLKLRAGVSSTDPTYIYASGTRVYAREGTSGTPQALTSDRVAVTTLEFTKHAHPGANDTVSVSLVVTYNTANIQQQFTQALLAGVRRVSAATFDSNVIPSADNTYRLGTSGATWNSINNILYFSGGNVGVAQQSPTQKMEIDGGLKLNPSSGKPSCSDSVARGTLWFTPGNPGQNDVLEICTRNASSSYSWVQIN